MTERRRALDAFDCAPGMRLDAHERINNLQINSLLEKVTKLELAMEKLEKRLWLAVYGIIGVILAGAIQSIVIASP